MSDKISITDIVKYIKFNVDYLSMNERQDILQMIINSSIEDSKIQTKGNGTQIKFRDIPQSVLSMIYSYIQTKLTSKMDELQYFPDKVEES